MLRSLIEDIAALCSLGLFVAMIAVVAQAAQGM